MRGRLRERATSSLHTKAEARSWANWGGGGGLSQGFHLQRCSAGAGHHRHREVLLHLPTTTSTHQHRWRQSERIKGRKVVSDPAMDHAALATAALASSFRALQREARQASASASCMQTEFESVALSAPVRPGAFGTPVGYAAHTAHTVSACEQVGEAHRRARTPSISACLATRLLYERFAARRFCLSLLAVDKRARPVMAATNGAELARPCAWHAMPTSFLSFLHL